jgi:tryptophan synthase alpha chain
MSVSSRLAGLRAGGRKALIPFVTAGDPSLEDLPAILAALEEGGADVIEIGIPFSDPIADGPTIQASSQRALDRGVTPTRVLEALSQSRISAPIVLMGYYNSVLARGLQEFAVRAKEAGASGAIISDLIPEDAGPWIAACDSAGLEPVFLAAPTSTDDRLRKAAGASRGFVYAVSRTGVTGAGSEAPPEVRALVEQIRFFTELPVCVGFGISRPEHVQMVWQAADGAVVGSHLVELVRRLGEEGQGYRALAEEVRRLREG